MVRPERKGGWKMSVLKRISGTVILAGGLLITGCIFSPPTPPTAAKSAQTALQEGRFQEALDLSEKALQVNGRNMTAIYVRGLAAFELKEWPVAADALEKATQVYDPSTVRGRKVLRTLALTQFYQREFRVAYAQFKDYLKALEVADGALLDEDLYWSGVLADVNLKDDERDRYWSRLSTSFKKSKGIE